MKVRRACVRPLAALGMCALAGCKVVDTTPPEETPAPRVEPTPWASETYAAALRAASLKLQGHAPAASEVAAVLEGGKPVYEATIDRYLDPSQNPMLRSQVRDFYRSLFLMGGVFANEGTSDSNPYAPTNTNYDLPANLATYLFVQDRPVAELLTADYCVGDDLSVLSEPVAQAACEGAPKVSALGNQRAGIMGMRPFLRKFGQPNTINMRRTSVVHQLFACGIYPDGEDPIALARTNDDTHDAGDNDQATGPNGESWSTFWPLNDNATASITTDDFPDPRLGSPANDPGYQATGAPLRISKKFQTAKNGNTCHVCHSRLNLRRVVFTPYDPEGHYDPARSMAHTRDPITGSTENNVESPEENGGADYCGALGDTEAVDGEYGVGNGNPTDDDLDPGAFECRENGKGPGLYFGREVRTLRDFGFAITDASLTGGRFQACMTTRHVNFVLGRSQGEISMAANGGAPPAVLDAAAIEKFSVVYEANDWSTRELMRVVFKSPEYLTVHDR